MQQLTLEEKVALINLVGRAEAKGIKEARTLVILDSKLRQMAQEEADATAAPTQGPDEDEPGA